MGSPAMRRAIRSGLSGRVLRTAIAVSCSASGGAGTGISAKCAEAGGIDLITIFIGLETMAVSFYILAGFIKPNQRNLRAWLGLSVIKCAGPYRPRWEGRSKST